MAQENTQAQVPATRDDGAAILAALKVGNIRGMTEAALRESGGDVEIATRRLARLAVALRQSNVAVIGDHEAFVRRTVEGELLQIIRPVRLSLRDNTLWRIPQMEAGVAKIAADGLLRMDEVVGSSKSVRITVEKGPPLCVHFDVRLVAAAPDTGNPVLVEYSHTEEAEHMLFEMLGKYADKAPESCYPCTEQAANDDPREGWRFWAEYGDEGYYCDMKHPEYKMLRKKFSEVLRYTRRKGYTIALRNAMKKHPAFGGRTTFEVDANGEVVIGVKGWAGKPEAVAAMLDIHKRLANGLPLPADVITIDGNAIDDPEDRDVAPSDVPGLTGRLAAIDEEAEVPDPEERERAELIDVIDSMLDQVIDPQDIAALEYDPASNTNDELTSIRDALRLVIQSQSREV